MEMDEHRQQALKFLEDADNEFEQGDTLQASEKLWGAASHAVLAVSLENGWRSGDHRALKMAAERLAVERNDPLIEAYFGIAEKFHANFYHSSMADFEVKTDRPKIRSFVLSVLCQPS